jgi:DNA/RNA-binding domain of Phe-tRNA-synthetase-like protein
MNCQMDFLAVSPACTLGTMTVTGLQNADMERLRSLRELAEASIRAACGGLTRAQLREASPMAAYVAYYKKFASTYHVLAQVESVVKGKGIPAVIAPVCVMFMAELQTSLLTAAHDLDAIIQPIAFRQAVGGETYQTLDGRDTATARDDWMVCDGVGVLSSILHGPDRRTAVTSKTENVLYAVYAPQGVAQKQISDHFALIRQMLEQVYDS